MDEVPGAIIHVFPGGARCLVCHWYSPEYRPADIFAHADTHTPSRENP